MEHPLLAPRRKPWGLILTIAAIVAACGAWTLGWSYAAGQVENRLAAWRAREADHGRIHSCGKQTITGFPLRVLLRCTNAVVELRHQATPLQIKAKEIVVLAQVYDPTQVTGEIVAPLTVSEPDRVVLTGNWAWGQITVQGLPGLEQISLVLDEPKFDQPAPSPGSSLGPSLAMRASRLELQGRLVSGRPGDNPVMSFTGRTTGAIVPGIGPFGEKPSEAEFAAVLHGLKSLAPRRGPIMLQEIQSNGGYLDVTTVRLQQGESIAVGSGRLALSPSGRPDGALRLTVAGVERLVQSLGLDRALAQFSGRSGALGLDRGGQIQNTLDRIMPGLGNAARTRAAEAGLQMGLAILGEQTQLEGRRAVAMPLRFSDGQTMLGPIRLGQVPPLY